jgi:protein TonB
MKKLVLLFLIAINTFAQKGVYQFNVDNFPSIDGGNQEIKRFLHDHLIYPAQDLKVKKEGTVKINFIVTKEGKSEQIKVSQSVEEAMDKEAIRLLKLIEWKPSYKGGKPVNVDFYLDVPFSVSKYKKAVKERGFDTIIFKELPIDTSLSVYEKAERVPAFHNNNEQTFTDFVYSNLQYPDVAMRQNIEGNMKITFIIEPDGMTSNINILNGLAGGCNDEAIRVIGLTKWVPAVRDGKYVRYRMNFTMNFSLKNNFKDNANGSQRTWGQ